MSSLCYVKVLHDSFNNTILKKKNEEKGNHQKNMSVKSVPPCRTPLLYSKTGVCRGIPIFLIFAQNIDCGYSLEPPQQGGSNVYPQSVLSKNKKNIKILLLKIFNF